MTATDTWAAMSTASINDLPDSAFAYIEPGGSKDADGKTTPRSLRHFPIHDEAHVRNALGRLSSSPFGDKARPKVMAAARKFGIEVSESEAADRAPFELRKRRRGSMVRKAERRGARLLEMRVKPDGAGGTVYEFEGYGAVFDEPFEMWDPWGDPYTEVVRPGAFTRTLARPDLDVPFLIGHNEAGIPLARTRNGTMSLAEDSRGMLVRARMDGRRTDVRNLASAVERRDADEMSIGFVTVGQQWSPDYEERSMLDLELHRGDVSVVALAAQPKTAGSTMVALPVESLAKAARAAGQADIAGPAGQGDEEPDTSTSPDYNPPQSAHAPMTGSHTHGHAAYGAPDGDAHGHQHSHGAGGVADASHDHGHLYSEDGTIVLDDSGVVEEVGGSMGDAQLLEMQLWLIEHG